MPRFLFRPKWIAFHALVAGTVVLMVNLGFWQLRRLDERRLDNEVLVERVEQDPVTIRTILDDPAFEPGEAENRRVLASGTYLSDQIVLFNRSQDGRAVDNVITPLVLDDGRILLVNRGSIGVEVTPPTPPAVGVEILGRLRASEQRQRGGLTDAADGPISQVRRVEIALLDPQFDGDLVPMFVELIASEPAVAETDPIPLSTPVLSEGNHLSYAFQWFIFSACVLIGWVLAVRRSVRTNRLNAVESSSRATPDSPKPTDDESTTALS